MSQLRKLRLFVPMGIPGSSKTTWVKECLESDRCLVTSSDDIRRELNGGIYDHSAVSSAEVWGRFYDDIAYDLSVGFDVVADATNLKAEYRRRYYEIAEEHGGVGVHLIVFKNIDQAIRRNFARGDSTQVSEAKMVDFLYLYEKALTDVKTEPYDTLMCVSELS